MPLPALSRKEGRMAWPLGVVSQLPAVPRQLWELACRPPPPPRPRHWVGGSGSPGARNPESLLSPQGLIVGAAAMAWEPFALRRKNVNK